MDYNQYLLGGKNPKMVEIKYFEEEIYPSNLTIPTEDIIKKGERVDVYGPAIKGYLLTVARSAALYLARNLRSYISGVDPFSGLFRNKPSQGYKDGFETSPSREEFRKDGIIIAPSEEAIGKKEKDESLDKRRDSHYEKPSADKKDPDNSYSKREDDHKIVSSKLEPKETTEEFTSGKKSDESIAKRTSDHEDESLTDKRDFLSDEEKLKIKEKEEDIGKLQDSKESKKEKEIEGHTSVSEGDLKEEDKESRDKREKEAGPAYREKDGKNIVEIDLQFLHEGRTKKIGDLERTRPEIYSIGHILVIPQGTETPPFRIPFEFNPDIDEGSYSAQYNAQTVLSRIGALQSYSHTDISTASIKSQYYALSEEGSNSGNAFMNFFTLKKIQDIQRMYQSLVFPKFPQEEEQSTEEPFSYNRPPFVKIIIGDKDSTLFTYPLKTGDLNSHSEKKNHKVFMVTSISIEKDLNKTPIKMSDDGGRIIDTFGFDVSMDIVEVTKNYMDLYPDFESYFKSFYKTAEAANRIWA